ncbi:iron dicitrate transport regulator FecR [Thalassospira profundimaris]|uniref:Iron dicitrate transport regulator FecR n=1 Tax=Thalassospira profundimaris TaxID=502049 RepID=A0A367WWN0_9PROT|nr:SIS domain-containing protein [Thalassospira profundimaris]RCK44911.1 iron dicitrate transport regulator FecR [Thalassospira profundimaris]
MTTRWTPQTQMGRETAQAPDVVKAQLAANQDAIAALVSELRSNPPAFVMTCGRGSSDHATLYAKYLIESQLGIPVVSAAPSITSIYGKTLAVKGALFIAVSQSGKSPDLVQSATAAKKAGARTVALVNVTDSPLAETVDHVIPLMAGAETSVAATKSYIATLSAIAQIVAGWLDDTSLNNGLAALPDQLRQALDQDWLDAAEPIAKSQGLYVIGRGPTFAIAQEAALKFKETSSLHAEAFSAAEVKHGPMALVTRDFPLLVFSQDDATRESIEGFLTEMRAKTDNLFAAETGGTTTRGHLPVVENIHPLLAPIAMIQTFYTLAEHVALHRGCNPDAPPHLSKVTETH